MKNHARSYLSPILVTGAHRSGTTWVGKMLAAAPGMAYISEPLNVLHRPGVFEAPVSHWYTYITEENESSYLLAFQKTLAYRYDLLAELRSLRSGRDVLRMMRDLYTFTVGRLQKRRPLLKDPFAVFSLEWFAKRLNCRVVVTVRHPAAFASSLKRLGWKFNLQKNLFTQPLLVRDYLEAYREAFEAKPPKDLIDQAAWLWRIIYHTVWQIRQRHPEFQIVRQEDLSLDPIGGFRQIYHTLGLDFTSRVEQTILTSSGSENPVELTRTHSIRLNSRASLHNWKKRLTEEEIARIRTLTADTWPLYYTEDEW
ncbi:MAG: sulfotransferase [Anaerolineales bacterium]